MLPDPQRLHSPQWTGLWCSLTSLIVDYPKSRRHKCGPQLSNLSDRNNMNSSTSYASVKAKNTLCELDPEGNLAPDQNVSKNKLMFSRKISQCLHIYDYSCLNLTVQVRKQEILIFYDSDSGGRKNCWVERLFQCFREKEFALRKKKKKKEVSGEFSSKEQTQKSGLKSTFWIPPITLTYVVSVNFCSISSQFKTCTEGKKTQNFFSVLKWSLKVTTFFILLFIILKTIFPVVSLKDLKHWLLDHKTTEPVIY